MSRPVRPSIVSNCRLAAVLRISQKDALAVFGCTDHAGQSAQLRIWPSKSAGDAFGI